MNRFRLLENLKGKIKDINREKPVSYLLEGGKEKRGHLFEILPYLELHEKGYLIQYYIIEAYFSGAGLHVQTYHMDQRVANAKYVTDDDIFKKSVSNRMYARMKYLEKSKGYTLLNTEGNDTVLLENIPIFSEKDGLSQDQIIGYDLTFRYDDKEDYIDIIEENKPLMDIKIYDQEDKRGIYIGGRSLIEYPKLNENILVEHFLPSLLSNPVVEVYGKFLNLHNKDAHLYLKDSLLYYAYEVFLKEYFFGDKSNIHEIEGDMIPSIYNEGFSGGTEVGKMINPETGEEVKIMANTKEIINHENPGNIFRDHLEKGPIKGTIIPVEERTSTNDDEEGEYSYRVECIYGFKNEMDADIFELLLDDIAQLDISEKVKVLKYIKNLKISKEEK